MKQYGQADRDKAKQMFVNEGFTIPQIESVTKIPKSSLYRWKRDDRWNDYIKASGQMGLGMKVQKEIVAEINKAIENNTLGDPVTADKLAKLSKVVESIMPKAMMLSNIFVLFEVLAEFVNNFTTEEFNKSFQKHMPGMSDYLRKKFATG
jgi:hypothetical protein